MQISDVGHFLKVDANRQTDVWREIRTDYKTCSVNPAMVVVGAESLFPERRFLRQTPLS